jgi:hypothetical protein
MAFVCVTGLIRSDENGKTTTLTTLLPICVSVRVFLLSFSRHLPILGLHCFRFPPQKIQESFAYFSMSIGPAKLLCRLQCAIKVNVSTIDVLEQI